MLVAFHAPLKAPDHPVPSGDRRLAQALVQALRARGHEVSVPTRLRSFDARGDAARQARLGRIGARIASRLAERYRATRRIPDVWFTYHVHHKAPDWLGPAVSAALGIPYVIAEASVAPRQRDGPWAIGYEQAQRAILAADAVIFVNPADIEQVARLRGPDGISLVLRPFLDVAALSPRRPNRGRRRATPCGSSPWR